jgi:hypothetical protein
MSGVIPFWITGEVKILIQHAGEAYVRVPNGNVYLLGAKTPGINFSELKIGTVVAIEITDRLDRVYSAKIISDAGECDGSTLGS